MARYLSASEAASLVQDNSFTDSSDESEVEEDPVFPLPHAGEDAEIDAADAEQPLLPVASLEAQPHPSLAPGLSTALDHSSSSPEAPDGSDTGRYYNYKYIVQKEIIICNCKSRRIIESQWYHPVGK